MKKYSAVLFLLIAAHAANSAHVTVGTDSCDEVSIQDAVDSVASDPNLDEVRIANNGTYSENVLIDDMSIIIRGGYVDCASAVDENPASRAGQTTITGVVSAGRPVIRITGSTQRHSIVFDSLKLTGGSGAEFSAYRGGGISAYHSYSDIEIYNTTISGNAGNYGGGIEVNGGSSTGTTIIYATDTLIYANTAQAGGGIYCDGTNASIVMSGDSGVSLNDATNGQGGGVYMNNGCDFTLYSGTDGNGGGFDIRGVLGNSATQQGGGIYAESASQITLYGHERCIDGDCIGDNINPVSLSANQSDSDSLGGDGDGGGAYITGNFTSLSIHAGFIRGNNAGQNGGAVYVNTGATLEVSRLSSSCWSPDHCNYFYNNRSGTSFGFGGAIHNNTGTIDIKHSIFDSNRADFGTAISASGSASINKMKSSIVHRNGNNGADNYSDQYVFSILSGASFDVFHSTIADNNAQLAVFNIPSVSIDDSDLYASIVDDANTGPVFGSSQSNNIFVRCSMLHEVASVPASIVETFVNDADFVDRANGDYHLNPQTSPAVDYCDDVLGPSNYFDIDFEGFGFDDSQVDNEYGPFDIGADETYDLDKQLSVHVNGGGTISSDPAGINCGVDCSEVFAINTLVTLTAAADSGYYFFNWTGDCTGSGSCVVDMSQSRNVTANFIETFHGLTTSVQGAGTITSDPAGIDCGVGCFQVYTNNTVVTLTPTPQTGYVFDSWSGACSGSSTCIIHMTQPKSVTALFVPNEFTLTATVSGSGTMTSSPAGINCGVDCAEDYSDGTEVTLTALASSGYLFSSWSGDCSGSSSCIVTMDQARSVRAIFIEEIFTLSVTVSGDGKITSNPSGIDCGSDCSEDYNSATSVTLSVRSEAGFIFDRWSGDCSGSSSCVVSMSQARSVRAIFVAETYTLTTTVSGNGTITSNPLGINCGNDCSEDYSNGTSVTLSAVPDIGFSFVGWSGDCSGSNLCVVTMGQARSVRANFTANIFNLTVNVSGSGTVISNTTGIECGVDCDEVYNVNTNVTLTASPEVGFVFEGWSGDCSGTGDCVLMMTQDMSVSAVFSEPSDVIFRDEFEE